MLQPRPVSTKNTDQKTSATLKLQKSNFRKNHHSCPEKFLSIIIMMLGLLATKRHAAVSALTTTSTKILRTRLAKAISSTRTIAPCDFSFSSDLQTNHPHLSLQSTRMFSSRTDDEDASAIQKSRAPFSMPKNSQDDSEQPSTKDLGSLEWNSLGLFTELVDSLEQQKLHSPTAVQRKVIPHLLQDPLPSTLFVAATGSGKTLAYTLPILQQLKTSELFQQSQNTTSNASNRRPKRPRAIFLAPTRELCQQIAAVVKSHCHHIKLSSTVIVGGGDQSYAKQKSQLNRPLDILVATPGRLLKHWNEGNVLTSSAEIIVMDEMDTLLEQGFSKELKQILYPVLYKKKFNQPVDVEKDFLGNEEAPKLVLTSATMTKSVLKMLGKSSKADDSIMAKKLYAKLPTAEEIAEVGGVAQNNPHLLEQKLQEQRGLILPRGIDILKTEGLHKAVPRLQQVFVDVGNTDKLSLLVDVTSRGGSGAALKGLGASEDEEKKSLTMVFCNTAASCRAAQYALAEAGINSLSYHGDLNSLVRQENLRRFRVAGGGEKNIIRKNMSPQELEEAARDARTFPRTLVCTDLAARGLDVPEVDHVIMFDFPLNAMDYIHRSGRTARGTNAGRVTALVSKRDKVLAQAIEQAVQRGDPLDGLTSRKSDYQPGGRVFESNAKKSGGRHGGLLQRTRSKKGSPKKNQGRRFSSDTKAGSRGRRS